MQSRVFNSISIDYMNGIFTKSSINTKKLHDEINYYLSLPESISSLFPSLLDYNKDYSCYRLDYIPYLNLSEFFLNNIVLPEEGNKIIERLLFILDKFHAIEPPYPANQDTVYHFYVEKTLERIKQLEKDDFFGKLFKEPILTINGRQYRNFPLLKNEFIDKLGKLSANHSKITAIHGDFCFSNILYSSHNHLIKLIDPRGSFGESGIYGHSYYDFAKLLHCLHGRYDYLANDKFILNEINNTIFYIDVPLYDCFNDMYEFYINLLIERNVLIEFVYLIEASLFLSMVSLHYENPYRQKVLYLAGLIILNNVIEGNYAHMY